MFAQEEPQERDDDAGTAEGGDGVMAQNGDGAVADSESASVPSSVGEPATGREPVPLGSPPSGYEWGFLA